MVRGALKRKQHSAFPIAPLQPESSMGKYLIRLLKRDPSRVPGAVEKQLKKLAEDRESQALPSESNLTNSDQVLYRRISELKKQERQRLLEEIIHVLVIQKFVESGVSMVPNLGSITSAKQPWQCKVKELEDVHPPEVKELAVQHMLMVVVARGGLAQVQTDTHTLITELRLVQVYAASIVYGYALRRIFHRYQLEKSFKASHLEVVEGKYMSNQGDEFDSELEEKIMMATIGVLSGKVVAGPGSEPIIGPKIPPKQFESYIMSLDKDVLQRMVIFRCTQSLSVFKKQIQALFERSELVTSSDGSITVGTKEALKIRFWDFQHLVLEALAFGSFLWDVESCVDRTYTLL
ncbi:hypothetical protein KP509_21G058000 [Ceratopteris richardii]|nr:hypothetical protein KP509_21G058000 [Ceratopteris richardii]